MLIHIYYQKREKAYLKIDPGTGPVSGDLQMKITSTIDINDYSYASYLKPINYTHIIHHNAEK